jgi:adenine-specific DNA glycosylase
MGKKPKEVMTGRHAAFIITRAAKAFLLKKRVSKMLLDGLNKKTLPQISQKSPNNLP